MLTILEPIVLAAVFTLVLTVLITPIARIITPAARATHSNVTSPLSSFQKRSTRSNIQFPPERDASQTGADQGWPERVTQIPRPMRPATNWNIVRLGFA